MMLTLAIAACGDDNEDDPIPFTGNRPATTTVPEDDEGLEDDEGSDNGQPDGDSGGPTSDGADMDAADTDTAVPDTATGT